MGDEVKLGASRGGLHGGMKTFKIAGLLSPRGAAGFNQGGVIFLPLKTAEYLFSKTGNINTISIVLAETADEKAVAAEIAKHLARRACASARPWPARNSPRKRFRTPRRA